MELPGVRGRESWDPAVADTPLRGVQSETGLTGDRRYGGQTSEERGEKKHVVRGQGLPTVHGLRTLTKSGRVADGDEQSETREHQGPTEYGRTEREQIMESIAGDT